MPKNVIPELIMVRNNPNNILCVSDGVRLTGGNT